MRKTLLAAAAVACLGLTLTACGGVATEPAQGKYDAMLVEVSEAMKAAPETSEPTASGDLNSMYGFDGTHEVTDFKTKDGQVVSVCVNNTAEDIYMVVNKKATYLGAGDCSEASRETATVEIDTVAEKILQGEQYIPSVAEQIA